MLLLQAAFAGWCKDESPDSLDFYQMAYSPSSWHPLYWHKSGSGDYSVQVENNYPSDHTTLVLKMKSVDSDDRLEGKLEQVEIPAGVLN